LREYQEELGIQTKLEFLWKNSYRDDRIPNKFLWVFTTISDGPFFPDKEVVEKIEFFRIEEIKNMINDGEKFHPELLFLLEKYIF
jgi:8-oxo-dGTP pyrophosphatase MutT (NUDIX family)